MNPLKILSATLERFWLLLAASIFGILVSYTQPQILESTRGWIYVIGFVVAAAVQEAVIFFLKRLVRNSNSPSVKK